jgi:hypothetical protein
MSSKTETESKLLFIPTSLHPEGIWRFCHRSINQYGEPRGQKEASKVDSIFQMIEDIAFGAKRSRREMPRKEKIVHRGSEIDFSLHT